MQKFDKKKNYHDFNNLHFKQPPRLFAEPSFPTVQVWLNLIFSNVLQRDKVENDTMYTALHFNFPIAIFAKMFAFIIFHEKGLILDAWRCL